jgi:hypothetical protein
MTPLLTGGLLAVALGLRHAVEPDHLAAVSTLVADRPGRRALYTGAVWGLGHTLALLAVGLALGLLREHVSNRFDDAFELLVAFMLLGLGARSLVRALHHGADGPLHAHDHGATVHTHGGAPDHVHLGNLTLARAPLFVGLLHGLAGSGALTALALASMPTWTSSLWFLFWFGLGAMAGMAALAGAAGLLLSRVLRTRFVGVSLLVLAGVLSLVLGLVRGWPLAVRLFAL